MADGEQTLKMTLRLSERAVQHLQEGADKLGLSLDAYASEVIEQGLFDYGDFEWGETDPRRQSAEPFDRTESTYSLEEVMAEFRDELEQRLAAKT